MKINSRGFSLVSVMVAIGLAGGLALILMRLGEQQSKLTKKGMVEQEMNETIGHFNSMIARKDACTANFVGKAEGDEFEEFRYSFKVDEDSFARIDADPKDNNHVFFRGTKIKVLKMRIMKDAEYEAEFKRIPDPNVVAFEVTFQKPQGNIGGRDFRKVFEIPVYFASGELLAVMKETAEKDCETKLGTERACVVDLETMDCYKPEHESRVFNEGTRTSEGDYLVLCKDLESNTDPVVISCGKE